MADNENDGEVIVIGDDDEDENGVKRMDSTLLQLKQSADSWSTTEVRSVTHKHLWTIQGFSQLECRYLETSAKIKDLTAQPTNQPSSSGGLPELPDITFRVRLHPQGNKESNKDFTFFQCFTNQGSQAPAPTYRAKFKFSVHNSRGDETPTTVYSGTQQLHGYFEYIRREVLMSHVQPSDELFISLNIVLTFDTVTKASQNIRYNPPEAPKLAEVTKDLETLLRSGKHTDFTLVVDGREIRAHRAILAARSPVFAAMMESHTAESQTSRVTLADIEYEVVQQLINFIYSGTCTKMGGYALEILAAADRFALPGLKNLAEAAMKTGLAADTVCKQLAHADLFCMSDFKKEAIKYICMNANAVVESDGFIELSKSNPHLIGEIMTALVSDKSTSFRDDSEPSSKRARMTETNL